MIFPLILISLFILRIPQDEMCKNLTSTSVDLAGPYGTISVLSYTAESCNRDLHTSHFKQFYPLVTSSHNFVLDEISFTMTDQLRHILLVLSRPTKLRVLISGHRGYDGVGTFVSISDIVEQDESFNNTDSLLLVQPLYCKIAKVDDQTKVFYRGVGSSKSSYDKMMFTMGVGGKDKDNIVVFLIGKGRNEEFWSRCLKNRDAGEVGERVYNVPFAYYTIFELV